MKFYDTCEKFNCGVGFLQSGNAQYQEIVTELSEEEWGRFVMMING